jgi:hypothetical protein
MGHWRVFSKARKQQDGSLNGQ